MPKKKKSSSNNNQNNDGVNDISNGSGISNSSSKDGSSETGFGMRGSVVAVTVAVIATVFFFVLKQHPSSASLLLQEDEPPPPPELEQQQTQQQQQKIAQQQQQRKTQQQLQQQSLDDSFSRLQKEKKQPRLATVSNPISRLLLLVDSSGERKQQHNNNKDIIEDDQWEYFDVDHSHNTSSIISETVVTVFPNGGTKDGIGEKVTLGELVSTGRTNFYDGQGRKVDLTEPITLIKSTTTGTSTSTTTPKTNNVDDGRNSVILRHETTKLYDAPTLPGLHFHWPWIELGERVVLEEPPSPLGGGKKIELEMLSKSPRIFYVHNFVSDKEIENLQEYAQSSKNPYKMARSTAGTHKSWANGAKNDIISTRTSTNAFDISSQTSKDIKRRAFKLLRIPKYHESMADGIQVLRYQQNQAYVAHHDYFPAGQSSDHNWNPQQGGSNRFATVFLYMTDVEKGMGGQTCFPNANLTATTQAGKSGQVDQDSLAKLEETLADANITKGTWEYELSKRCYYRFSVQPTKRSALLFYSQLTDGTLDKKSLHGAGPVLGGPEKWGANVWVWNACRFSLCSKDKAQNGLTPTNDIDFVY